MAGRLQHAQIGEASLEEEEESDTTFEGLGLCAELCRACAEAGWRHPTRIQAAAIPAAMQRRDVVGVAQTGSGKTAAYVLPVVDWLLRQPKVPYLSAMVIVPTRELGLQVTRQFEMLGTSVGLRVACLVGGIDMVSQACELAKRPHVLVGTPGRVKDHLINTKGFTLVKLRTLVLDEADKMLDMDYDKELDAILQRLPTDRQTMLFSATLNAKVDRLQKASLHEPLILEAHRKNSTVETLKQFFIFAPYAQMLPYLHVYLTQEAGSHILIFCSSAHLVHKLTITLRVLGHRALPLMGRMQQTNRLVALEKFREGKVRILVCTDVAQRGLDIPATDVVVNYSLPLTVKDYIHRVGRTARAGSHGKAVNLISQYDILQLQNIEATTGKPMEELRISEHEVNDVLQRVEDAEQEAHREMREHEELEKLNKEQRSVGAARHAKRKRSEALGYDDAQHNQQNFNVMRMRRENEEVFNMTQKKAHNALRQLHRKARRGSKNSSAGAK